MPVVPRIDSPPTMPSRPLRVLAASASPPGMAISISTSPASPWAAAISAMASRIIWRGTGLMAGSPGGMGRPGRVTVPTPSPARKLTPLPRAARRTVARISAPWVTSGSSPASLTTPAVAVPSPSDVVASAKAGCCPRGRVTSTGSGNSPGQQRLIGRLGGRRGAGAGGPAIAERAVVGCHVPRYSARQPLSSLQETRPMTRARAHRCRASLGRAARPR